MPVAEPGRAIRQVIDLGQGRPAVTVAGGPARSAAAPPAVGTPPVPDDSPSLRGADGLFWRRDGRWLKIAENLADLCPAPRPADIDLMMLTAMALGVSCLPGRTHLRDVGRVPPGGLARICGDGIVLRKDPAVLAALRYPAPPGRPGDRARLISAGIRDAPQWRSPDGCAVAFGGCLGSRFLLGNRPDGGCGNSAWITINKPATTAAIGNDADGQRHTLPVRFPSRHWPSAWPPFLTRHLPAALAVTAAASAGLKNLMTGHGLHELLSAAPGELAMVRPGRWTGEPPAGRKRPAYLRRPGSAAVPSAAPGADDAWGWLTADAAVQVRAIRAAASAAWADWTFGHDPRVGALLTSWADLSLAALREAARYAGVQLTAPAWRPPVLQAALALPLSERVGVDHGLIVQAPLLRISAASRTASRSGGDHRCRRAAAAWAASPHGARSLGFLADGYLVHAGILDSGKLREAVADPFTRTEHALALRRLSDADSWLAGL